MQSFRENEPTSYLDNAIVRVAVLRARKSIAQGLSIDEAVRLACRDSWSQWRLLVQARLESGLERMRVTNGALSVPALAGDCAPAFVTQQ